MRRSTKWPGPWLWPQGSRFAGTQGAVVPGAGRARPDGSEHLVWHQGASPPEPWSHAKQSWTGRDGESGPDFGVSQLSHPPPRTNLVDTRGSHTSCPTCNKCIVLFLILLRRLVYLGEHRGKGLLILQSVSSVRRAPSARSRRATEHPSGSFSLQSPFVSKGGVHQMTTWYAVGSIV